MFFCLVNEYNLNGSTFVHLILSVLCSPGSQITPRGDCLKANDVAPPNKTNNFCKLSEGQRPSLTYKDLATATLTNSQTLLVSSDFSQFCNSVLWVYMSYKFECELNISKININ